MLSFTQPYLIIRWLKIINIPTPLDTNTKFVLVSTNSEKCESLKTYGNSVRSDTTVAIKISNIESQTFNRLLIRSLDATSMKQELLAQMIFASAGKFLFFSNPIFNCKYKKNHQNINISLLGLDSKE